MPLVITYNDWKMMGSGIFQHAKNVWNDDLQISDDLLSERFSICEGCEFWNGLTCGKCGCFTHEKIKWKQQDCPLGKWPKIQ